MVIVDVVFIIRVVVVVTCRLQATEEEVVRQGKSLKAMRKEMDEGRQREGKVNPNPNPLP